jgi:hypothetical protein
MALTPVDQVHDRAKVMAAACLALVVATRFVLVDGLKERSRSRGKRPFFPIDAPEHSADFAENFPPAWRSRVRRHDR